MRLFVKIDTWCFVVFWGFDLICSSFGVCDCIVGLFVGFGFDFLFDRFDEFDGCFDYVRLVFCLNC